MQGYRYHRPMPASELVKLLQWQSESRSTRPG
jgi:EAL domain-containing protein (putative c-di-GMP-specific phosphodiesterase class I)